jgi:hypothetical protein
MVAGHHQPRTQPGRGEPAAGDIAEIVLKEDLTAAPSATVVRDYRTHRRTPAATRANADGERAAPARVRAAGGDENQVRPHRSQPEASCDQLAFYARPPRDEPRCNGLKA